MSCSSIPPLPSHLQSQIGQSISTTGGSWGAVITPAAPEFSPNFPSTIYIIAQMQKAGSFNSDGKPVTVNLGRWSNGHCRGEVKFYIIPKNLNYAPVYDARLGGWTNGMQNNESFGMTYTSEYTFPNQGPFGPIQELDPVTLDVISERFVTEGKLKFINASIDPHTGLVQGSLVGEYLDDLKYNSYSLPVTLTISNGNGVATKQVNLVLTDVNVSDAGSGAIRQCDLPYPSGVNGKRVNCQGEYTSDTPD